MNFVKESHSEITVSKDTVSASEKFYTDLDKQINNLIYCSIQAL